MRPSKLILITGVTRGLGRALTAEFLAQDHRVISCGRSQGAIDELRPAYCADAGVYPSPEEWAKTAVSYLLALGPEDNGQSLSVGDR